MNEGEERRMREDIMLDNNAKEKRFTNTWKHVFLILICKISVEIHKNEE